MFSLILCSLFGLCVDGLTAVTICNATNHPKILWLKCFVTTLWETGSLSAVAYLSQPHPTRVTRLRLWRGVSSSGLLTLPLLGILFSHAFLGWVGFCFLLYLWCSEINLRPHACTRQTFYLWAKFPAPPPPGF